MVNSSEGEFSGKRWNRLVDESVAGYKETVQQIVGWMTEGGPPFGYAQRSEYSQLEELRSLRAMNSDAYWLDPAAQRKLAQLEARYSGA